MHELQDIHLLKELIKFLAESAIQPCVYDLHSDSTLIKEVQQNFNEYKIYGLKYDSKPIFYISTWNGNSKALHKGKYSTYSFLSSEYRYVRFSTQDYSTICFSDDLIDIEMQYPVQEDVHFQRSVQLPILELDDINDFIKMGIDITSASELNEISLRAYFSDFSTKEIVDMYNLVLNAETTQ